MFRIVNMIRTIKADSRRFCGMMASAVMLSPMAAQAQFESGALSVPPGGALAVVVPPTPPKVAKPSGMAALIKGQFPLTLRVDEMDYRWRELRLHGATYFTKGDTRF